MIKRLDSVSGYTDFINEINRDPDFGDPMLRTQEQMKTNLYDAVKRKETNYAFGIFDGQEMTGLFVFLISEDESYIEMLAKAIELNKPHAMTLLVDVDNEGAIALYTSAGFEKVSGENNITAHLRL